MAEIAKTVRIALLSVAGLAFLNYSHLYVFYAIIFFSKSQKTTTQVLTGLCSNLELEVLFQGNALGWQKSVSCSYGTEVYLYILAGCSQESALSC